MTSNQYTHTKALLNYLIAAYPASPASTHRPTSANVNNALLHSVQKLALQDEQRAAKQQPSSSSNSTAPASDTSEEENDTDPDRSIDSTRTGTSSTSDTDPSSNTWASAKDEEHINSVIALLEDQSVDDDDRPEALKELLSSILGSPDGEPINLDPLILALLHRHREDLSPSSNPVPPLPNHGSTTPSSRPSVSRSSSFRRNLQSTTPLTMSSLRTSANSSSNPNSNSGPGGTAMSSSVSSSSSRSAPNSPFRSQSPSLRQTPTHSPWSSPRPAPLTLTLNAAAAEFKFSAGASEFRPGSGQSSPIGIRSRSPNPMTAQAAQERWAATSSPLGTPKYASSTAASIAGGGGSGYNSAVSSPSYFPRHLEAGVKQQLAKKKIPRLPWADSTDSGSELGERDNYGGSNAATDTDDDDVSGGNNGEASVAYLHTQPAEEEWDELQRQQSGYRPFGDEDDGSGPPDGVRAPFGANGQHWDPFQSHEYGGGYAEGYTPTLETAGGAGAGYALPEMDDDAAEFAQALAGGGISGVGAYQMTPFDVLHSVFAGSYISPNVLEEALVMTGFDVDAAIQYLIDTQPEGGFGAGPNGSHVSTPTSPYPPPLNPPPPPGIVPNQMPMAQQPPRPQFVASGSKPLVVSRDSFDGYVGGNGGRGSPSGGPRWQSTQNQNQNGGEQQRGVGGRVCRYYLAGNCLRSDCKFSHDVGKAVCKFWLRGHCLKGDGRCDFLHSIPPIMRADFEARARQRAAGPPPPEEIPQDSGPDLDFPTLGEAPRSRRPGVRSLDPTRTRFSGAVKFGRPNLGPQHPPLPRPVAPPVPSRESMPQPRYSARINLRPPALLPTLPTGAALSKLYLGYRQSFLELGANRNKCLAKAAECWKRGDGAGARTWSREAQDWNRQVAIEGRDSANRIIEERKRLIKEALDRNEGRGGTTDDIHDRRARGRERGGGVCLGVVSQAILARNERALTVDERTEVALDLHGLHADEAVASLGSFLSSLEQERFAGLAFVVIGQAKHSGQNDPQDRGAQAGRLRLEQACSEFLSDQGWAWQIFQGIFAVDTMRRGERRIEE
ncbi:hypothetical protein T439DRAFT_380537 [Meredithblackwellia eburnea MCA 4105]